MGCNAYHDAGVPRVELLAFQNILGSLPAYSLLTLMFGTFQNIKMQIVFKNLNRHLSVLFAARVNDFILLVTVFPVVTVLERNCE